MLQPSLADRRSAALAELARWRADLAPPLAALSPPVPFSEIEARLGEVLPLMPDPGWRAPTMRAFSTSGAIYVAVYLALAPRGLDAAAAWALCEAAPVGGRVARYVAGDDQSDFGVDYTRCAIRELAIAAGAADFAPFICNADAIGSAEFGWGLVRTETLAQGGRRCDFRFKRGGDTRVGLHVVR